MQRYVSIVVATVLAATVNAFARAKLELGDRAAFLARQQLQKDIKIEVKKVSDGICGSEGPAYVVFVKIKRFKKSLDEKTEKIQIENDWVTIKKFGAPANELKRRTRPALMDADSCLE